MSRTTSNGSIGENLVRHWFNRHGWRMHRHQPPTRVVTVRGKPVIVPCESDGVFDYSGYQMSTAQYRAVEVKEAHGDSMEASRLTKQQRNWGAQLPSGCAWVAVCWMDGSLGIEVFPFVTRGAYKRGCGESS